MLDIALSLVTQNSGRIRQAGRACQTLMPRAFRNDTCRLYRMAGSRDRLLRLMVVPR
jgi:hypothetical protein